MNIFKQKSRGLIYDFYFFIPGFIAGLYNSYGTGGSEIPGTD